MTNPTSTLKLATRAFAIAVLIGTSVLGLPASAAEPAAAPVAQSAQQTVEAEAPVAQTATRSEVDGYAVREQAANALEKFQGGDTVVIVGGTTILIVILVILIIVLI